MRLLLAVLLAGPCAAQTGVVTYHNDNARTGVYSNEILLTPASIQSGMFGKRYSIALDGAVYAQPLYLSRVKIAGQGLRNVFFVATSHDSLYAFDADDQSGFSAQPLWRVNFLDPVNGVTTVSQTDVNCPVIAELGISGTPVIDPASGTIYLIAETKEAGSKFVFRLHAIDVTSGSERPGSPVEIQPEGFVPLAHKQRTGLLLSNGVVYSTWSGHCDLGTYHGWVMAHDAATLRLVGAFNDSPGASGASFWNGGAGPSADANGNVYAVTANGDFGGNTSLAEYDESVLKLAPAPALSVSDIFTPFDKLALDEKDLDLGSSGAIVLPDDAGSPAHPHLLFTSGKEGRMYLLDRENLGGAQTGSDSGAVASLPALSSNATFGMSAYFHGALYIAPENSPMFSFPLSGGSLAFSPSAQTSTVNGIHGATPSISSNGARDGVVWVVSVNDGGKLLAYDAAGLSQLYDSSFNSADAVPGYIEFAEPTVADGRVYVGAGLGIAVYGQLASTAPVVTAVANAASYSTDAISPGSLISLFGAGLAATTSAAAATPLPLSMADTSVKINGLVAPLLFVSPRQINAQVPSGISPGPASVVVRKEGALSTPVTINVHAAAPGVFTDGQGRAAAIDPDGLPNSAMNAAPAGELVSLYFTGLGPVAAPVEDGAAPSAGETITATSPISATIGGLPAEIQFAGLAPLYPGVAQLNLKVPALASGIYPLVISVGGSASNSVPLAISSH